MNEVVFREGDEVIPNPERGFYAPRMSHRMDRLDALRERGITLVLLEMDLRDFKERDISPEKLDELRRAFAAARQHGLKVIFRAAYGFTGRDYRADPKDMGRIRGHIRQLGSVFAEDRDVLCGVQAGFLGPWGEWHGSNWGDPPSLEARREVLFGLLDAVPPPITVHVRRPMFIRDIFADEPGGSELTAESAYGGSRLSRTGWHDDALLSLPSDMGTFAERGWDRERELRWCRQPRALHALRRRDGPLVREDADRAGRPRARAAPRDLSEQRLSPGDPERLARRGVSRGGRVSAHRASTRLPIRGGSPAIHAGGRGGGHAARRAGAEERRVRLAPPAEGGGLRVEPGRADAPGRHGRGRSAPVGPGGRCGAPPRGARPPPRCPPGRWRLALHLADPSPRLHDDGRYAIRLANRGISFSEATGWNVLAEDVDVKSRLSRTARRRWTMTGLTNLFAGIPVDLPRELFQTLLATPSLRIERIVSLGHASPEGFWYDQEAHEWVLLLAGAARLTLEGDRPIDLRPGAFVDIPARRRHRVEWTDPTRPTIWLAIHHEAGSASGA